MNMIYSRENILKRLQSTKSFYKKALDEDYFLVDIIYAFNSLTMNEQDFYLNYNFDSKDNNFEANKEELKKINIKMRQVILNGDFKVSDKIRIVIKNPEFKSSKKNSGKEKLDNRISDVKQGKILLNNGVIKLEDILDEQFGKDEKELIHLKYSENPPLSNSAVALRKGVDTDEVNETTNKLYKTAFAAHKKLVLMRENSNERNC